MSHLNFHAKNTILIVDNVILEVNEVCIASLEMLYNATFLVIFKHCADNFTM